MTPRISLLDSAQAVVWILALAGCACIVFLITPPGHGPYEDALLNFITSETALTRDVHSIQTDAVSHFDDLTESVRGVRRAEGALNNVPPHVSGSTAFNDVRLDLAVRANQKLALVEDFKTALAMLRLDLDALPRLIAQAEDAVPSAAGDTRALMLRVTASLTAYVQDPSPAIEAHIATQTTTLSAMAGEDSSPPLRDALSSFARQAEDIVAHKKRLDTILREMSSVPLLARGAALSDAYHAAHEARLRGMLYILCTMLGLFILAGALLSNLGRWRALGKVRAESDRIESLKEALKASKAQSASLKRGEEEQLARLAEERHQALVEHAFDLMAILSRQENYIHVSPASVSLLGLTEKELIGKSVYEGIHTDDIIKVQDYLTRAQKELQTEQTVQYRLMDAFGKWHLVETFASNQASNPAIRGMVLNTRRLGPAPVLQPK